MRLRWLLFDYVPPELELRRGDRLAVNLRAKLVRPLDLRHPANRRARRLYLLVVMPFLAVFLVVMFSHLDGPALGWRMIGFAALLAGIWISRAYSRGKTHGPFVWQALREKGYDVCRKCSYHLRGLDESVERCPECGWLREKLEHCAA